MSVIEMNKVTKYYGDLRALHELDLSMEKGEVLGFIGPNGAGKTTTIRILLGLLHQDKGDVRVFGKHAWHDAVEIHKKLAYVPGDVHLWPNLTGGEVIDLLSKLRGGLDPQKREELLGRFNLDPRKKCGTYSKGNRQKVGLIAAFASDADLFILDEPTSGLDPLMVTVFQDCVTEVREKGKTVLMSSHILADVEKLCDRVSIIRKGEIVESGTLDDLRHLTRTTISVETVQSPDGLNNLPGIYDLDLSQTKAKFQVETDYLKQIMQYLAKLEIVSLTSAPPTLEDLFMQHYSDDLEELNKAQGRSG